MTDLTCLPLFLQLGANPSSVGNSLLTPGTIHVLGPGAVFGLLQNKYKYSIQFIDHSEDGASSQEKSSSKKAEEGDWDFEDGSNEDNFKRTGSRLSQRFSAIFKSSTGGHVEEESPKRKDESTDGNSRKKFKLSFGKSRKSKDKYSPSVELDKTVTADQADNMTDVSNDSKTLSPMDTGDKVQFTSLTDHLKVKIPSISSDSANVSSASPMDTTDGDDLFSSMGPKLEFSDFEELRKEFGGDFIKEVKENSRKFSRSNSQNSQSDMDQDPPLHQDKPKIVVTADSDLETKNDIPSKELCKQVVNKDTWNDEEGVMIFSKKGLQHTSKVSYR